jgi:hypothetical protein
LAERLRIYPFPPGGRLGRSGRNGNFFPEVGRRLTVVVVATPIRKWRLCPHILWCGVCPVIKGNVLVLSEMSLDKWRCSVV